MERVRRSAKIAIACGIAARIGIAGFVDTASPDAVHFSAIADSITRGGGYADVNGPTAYWVPLYATLLGAARMIPGGARLLELVLSIATIVLAGAFARRAYGVTAGWIAAAIVALLPSFALLASTHLSENLGIPAMLGTLVLAIAMARRGSLGDVVIGAASGLAILAREACAAVLPAVALVLWTAKRRAASIVVVFAVATLAMAPWVFRNARTIGVATLSTSSGDNLCVGLGEGATGGWRRAFEDGGRPAPPEREAERHRAGLACAAASVREHPLQPILLVPAKLSRLFAWDDWLADDVRAPNAVRTALAAVTNLAYWLVLALALRGARRGRMNPLARAALAGVVATTIVIVLVTFGNGRFHAPLLALFAAPAARGLLTSGSRALRGPRLGRPAPST